mmetsp:Transcript_67019/g.169230  ORF Transcript_67019/g.169230 Transcript_67019/m.169230 type:complete len:337 (-) Transcript_67019:62-1072(-)
MSHHKKRRERRYQAAALLVGDSDQLPKVEVSDPKVDRSEDAMLRDFAKFAEDMCSLPSDPLGSGAGHGGRSQQPSDDLSSCMFQPRWHRLLHALGDNVARLIDNSCSDDIGDEASRRLSILISKTDGAGGGTVEDVSKFLEGLLVKTHLNDTDAGFVLLHACHHSQSGDLGWSSATWRSLLLLTALVAVREVCSEGTRESAREEMLAYVAHWWPRSEIDAAAEAFVERSAYKRRPPSRSALAKLYFELRDQGLRLSAEEASNASAVFLSDNFESSKRSAASADLARRGGFGDDSGGLSVSSLRFSDTESSFSSSAIPDEIFTKKKAQTKKKSIMSL